MVKHDIDYSYFRRTKIRVISDWAPPLVIFIAAFSLYIKTMASSVTWGDYGAFAGGNIDLGSGSGTPFLLYTFLIRLIDLIPGVSPLFLSSLLSAFFSAVAVMMFYLVIKKLSDIHVYQKNFKDLPGYQKLAEINPNLEEIGKPINIETISSAALTTIPSMAAAALFGLTLPVWLAAVQPGSFSLFLALTLAAIYFAIEGTRINNLKYFFLGFWMYALSFACQPIIALALIPAFLYLIIRKIADSSHKPAVLFSIVLLFIASFSIYFYMPIHSTLESVQNSGIADKNALFGSLSTLTNIEALPSNALSVEYLLRLKKLAFIIADEIGWIAVGLLLFGLWGTFKASKKIFPFFPLAILGNLALLIWLGKIDSQSYELTNYPALLIGLIIAAMTIGLLYLLRLKLQAAHSSVYVAICLMPLIYASAYDNYKIANKSELNGAEFISEKILKDIPDKSLVIVANENLLQPLLYYRSFETNKENISIISSDALANADYRRQVRENNPQLLYPAEFNSASDATIDKLIPNLCRLNSVHRKIFVQYGVPGVRSENVKPVGVMFMYVGNHLSSKMDIFSYRYHLEMAEKLFARNENDPMALKITGQWLYDAGQYYDDCGNNDVAWRLYDRALSIDQKSVEIRILLADQLSREAKFEQALRLISDALEIDSDDPGIMELGSRIEIELRNRKDIAVAE